MGKRRGKKKSKRICLRCDRKFMSKGIYNRICPKCRKSNANITLHTTNSATELLNSELDLALKGRRSKIKTSNEF